MADVYIASSFSLVERVEKVHDALVGAGHRVPDVWWDGDQAEVQEQLKQLDDMPDEEWYQQDVIVRRALDHWANIRACDVYVIVAPYGETRKFNGASIEEGYAFAHGLDAYSVGDLERSAMHVGPDRDPVTQTEDAQELIEVLETESYTAARIGNLAEIHGESCADCGRRAPVVGPINLDGEVEDPGDFCCRTCAVDRGVRVVRDDGD